MHDILSETGRFGQFGGCYVPEGLIAPIQELTQAFTQMQSDHDFQKKLHELLCYYAGRATPLTEVKRFSQHLNGPRIFLKREDLLHTGAHKINNALGQCLLAKSMGKTRIIAETGAGQHGVATATACAFLNLACTIYMGARDAERQSPNVKKMQLLGATVTIVHNGSMTLKDAINEALRDWASSYKDTHYCIGSALGPHPYPSMVAYFQAIIGKEAKQQILALTGQLPHAIIACVGGGSNAIGIFSEFIRDEKIDLIGVEAGGKGQALGQHAARMMNASVGILHGTETFVLQDHQGQIAETYSISAGLDYPAIGPQHAALYAMKRARYCHVNDELALSALKLLSKTEGIIPALESAHAIAFFLTDAAKAYHKNDIVIVNLSGRGDKDLPELFQQGLLS
ncbi:MAG: tryptophan synthase subunit beta [Gammaproteobacteria bacterium RIFCSPHIGHO2_12_FULL_41_15]|nr:MAG: tryptophan synthase subunit beta [Gammaproteobacteria bacterium RIFCSPHIGHO2_12_FULL_41_15]